MEDLIQAVHTRQTQDRLEAKDYTRNNYIYIPLCSELPSFSQSNSNKDVEKNGPPTTENPNPTSSNSTSILRSSISILIPLLLAYGLLFYTNWYIRSPLFTYQGANNPSTNKNKRGPETSRMAPLILILNILAPSITSSVLDTGTTPSWGFGALAWSITLLVPQPCTSELPCPGKKRCWSNTRACDKLQEKREDGDGDGELQLQARTQTWTSTRISTLFQLLIAAIHAYLIPTYNMTLLLHVLTSLLLFRTAAHLQFQTNTRGLAGNATTTTVLARMLIPSAFLCQALLLTQLSDEEGVVLFLVLGVGMVGNVVGVLGGQRE